MSEPQPLNGNSRAPDDETRASAAEPVRRTVLTATTGSSAFGPSGMLDQATVATPVGRSELFAAPPPDAFPGYRILHEIHRGGQGVVYQAIQQTTRRKVAIKVMREGPFAGAMDQARFEREVHVLGQLNHPNIVAIHESGVAAGNHYFVMNYISGQSLDEYVRSSSRSVPELLGLFGKICDAVNAAHLRGIIHRDLKPGNIRVDAEGEPHVLDFGLAKTLLNDADSSMMTMTGQFMGSLPWASPEQAEAIPSKIDLRADVYSLGVILYQMLTSKFPYEVTGSVRDVLDRIIRTEPARPRTIRKQVNDEVETIVLKCLAKERERRYQSAGELARDVRRYLAGEPIEAKRDSAWYVISKAVRRHRLPAACGAASVVVLIGFAATMTFAYGRVREEARKAELVAGFLDGILTSVDPDVARADHGGPLHQAVRETVDAAAGRIDDLAAEPDVQAQVRNSLGRMYMNLGEYQQAQQQLQAATDTRRQLHGDSYAPTAESANLLAWALKERGAYDEAEQLYNRALAARQKLFGEHSLPVAETLNGLGQLYYAQRRYSDAEPHLRRALDLRRQLGATQRDVASSVANLGSLLRDADRLDEAEPLLRDALAIREQLFGDRHFHTVVSKNKLGLLLRDRGNLAAAHELLETSLRDRKLLLGDRHPHVAASLNNLALVLLEEGQYAEAVQRFEEALSVWRAMPDSQVPMIARGLTNLAAALHQLGDHDAALARCQEAIDLLPPDSVDRSEATGLLGRLYLEHGDAAAAEPLLRANASTLQDKLGPEHRRTALAARDLASCLTALGQFDEAQSLLRESFPRLKAAFGERHPETVRAVRSLVRLYTDWEQPAMADEYRAMLPADAPASSTNRE